MKTTSVILLSVGLTLLLLGLNVSLYQSRRLRPPAPKTPAVQEVTNTVRRVIRYHPTPPPPPPPPPKFNWGMVEAEDYATYIANLRNVGCPEKTIRDIIRADIEKHFEAREQLLMDEVESVFWQTGAQRNATQKRFDRRSLELSREKFALLRELLGTDVDAASEKLWLENPVALTLLGFLPDAKAERVAALYIRGNELRFVQRTLTDQILTPADLAAQEKTYRAILTELGQILTPVEIEELQLRLAMVDRTSISSVEMTGAELRRYARLLVDAGDPIRGIFNLTGEVTGEQEELAAKKLADEVLKLLGQTRFADYQRDQDGRFLEVFSLTEQNQLPKTTAIKIYEIRQAADAQAEQARNDPTLSDDERAVLLTALRVQTEKAFARYLGPKIFAEYQKSGAHWLDQLKVELSPLPPLPPGN